MIIEGNVINADEGMVLTNGDVYSEQVHLGIYDSPANWREIRKEDIPDDPEIDDAEALEILLGGGV